MENLEKEAVGRSSAGSEIRPVKKQDENLHLVDGGQWAEPARALSS